MKLLILEARAGSPVAKTSRGRGEKRRMRRFITAGDHKAMHGRKMV